LDFHRGPDRFGNHVTVGFHLDPSAPRCPSFSYGLVFISDSARNLPTSIRVGVEPSTTCAMRETSLVETAPSTESGVIHYRPSGGRGCFQPSENLIKLGTFLPLLFAQ
jgi:hypothetical protein